MNKYPRRAQNLNISIKYKIKHVFQITTKTNNEPNFQYTKLSVIELVLTDKRNLSGARPRSACGKSFSCRFSLSAARNVITKVTEYAVSDFSFSSPSRKVWTSLSVSDTDFQCFISLNPKKFRQTTSHWEWCRLCRSFINRKQLIGDIKHTRKKMSYYLRLSQDWISLYNTAV